MARWKQSPPAAILACDSLADPAIEQENRPRKERNKSRLRLGVVGRTIDRLRTRSRSTSILRARGMQVDSIVFGSGDKRA